jgi:hypothetical protein
MCGAGFEMKQPGQTIDKSTICNCCKYLPGHIQRRGDLTEASINTESAAIVRKIQPEMPFQAVWLRPRTVDDKPLTYFEE